MKSEEGSSREKMTDCGIECPYCKGMGWVFVNDEDVKECECGIRQKKILDCKLKFASIPETYKDISLKDVTTSFYKKQDSRDKMKTVAKLLKWYLDNLETNIEDGKGLFFWSKTKGSGKTMVATALANELVNVHGKYVKFATSLDILDEIRATYNDHSEENENRLIKDLVAAQFLVIDDFGTERATDWAGEKFYQIVNKRYIDKKVTIFTSNNDLTTLKYDDRITNRIKERSYIARFPEESVRDIKADLDNQALMESINGKA